LVRRQRPRARHRAPTCRTLWKRRTRRLWCASYTLPPSTYQLAPAYTTTRHTAHTYTQTPIPQHAPPARRPPTEPTGSITGLTGEVTRECGPTGKGGPKHHESPEPAYIHTSPHKPRTQTQHKVLRAPPNKVLRASPIKVLRAQLNKVLRALPHKVLRALPHKVPRALSPSGTTAQSPSGTTKHRPSGTTEQSPSGTTTQSPSGNTEQSPSGANTKVPRAPALTLSERQPLHHKSPKLLCNSLVIVVLRFQDTLV
jgi:hypothetical protein